MFVCWKALVCLKDGATYFVIVSKLLVSAYQKFSRKNDLQLTSIGYKINKLCAENVLNLQDFCRNMAMQELRFRIASPRSSIKNKLFYEVQIDTTSQQILCQHVRPIHSFLTIASGSIQCIHVHLRAMYCTASFRHIYLSLLTEVWK